MRRRWVALGLTLLVAGCSSSGEAPAEEPVSDTSTTAATSTTTSTTAPPELNAEELAIAAARQAALEAGVMGDDFVDSSIAEIVATGGTVEVTLVPADPDVIGATAVVELREDDLSVMRSVTTADLGPGGATARRLSSCRGRARASRDGR